MPIKNMRRSDWKRVLSKEEIMIDCAYKNHKGKAALLKILDLSSPLKVKCGSEEVIIADKGYIWVQQAFQGEYYWITAMFDDKKRLIEIYVDLTDGNMTECDDPHFSDMYLDYTLLENEVTELDRDELDEAFNNGIISEKQYENTITEGKKVLHYLQENKQAVKEHFISLLNELENCMVS